ncbi:nucleotidyl transferase AbiEii/AbiGii toxin family protein [Dactylosporangium sp. CS-033363]|uniref:nucleotidyl transferase AbiEii/AbiGii toxin family protein n=1 Tax=Dactylosporangium sp. CS-033363 TaxID=3239935 RepID=UPI003D920DA9
MARIGLGAGDQFGFALAGGYAVQAAGLLERPSEDVDLFTSWDRRSDFNAAVAAVVDAYTNNGLKVSIDVQFETFARLIVADGQQVSKVELGVDWRANDPVVMAIGPVLHPDDAVANKMAALYGRASARDFIDIDAAVSSGRYDHETLLRFAERADSGFDRGFFAAALGRAQVLDDDTFAEYGLDGPALEALRTRFAAWRATLLNAQA